MNKPFSNLRKAMSAHAQAKAREKAAELGAEIDQAQQGGGGQQRPQSPEAQPTQPPATANPPSAGD